MEEIVSRQLRHLKRRHVRFTPESDAECVHSNVRRLDAVEPSPRGKPPLDLFPLQEDPGPRHDIDR